MCYAGVSLDFGEQRWEEPAPISGCARQNIAVLSFFDKTVSTIMTGRIRGAVLDGDD